MHRGEETEHCEPQSVGITDGSGMSRCSAGTAEDGCPESGMAEGSSPVDITRPDRKPRAIPDRARTGLGYIGKQCVHAERLLR